jgi:hypothetical protein
MRICLLFRLVLAMACWLGLVAGGSALAVAQAPPAAAESAVKAAFLYKFASFVEWPPGAFQRPDQPLVIAVSGDDPVAADLEQLAAGRMALGRPVTVRRVADPGAAAGIHVLFIGSRREGRLREMLDAIKGPVLVVTDQAGALRLGSVINFLSEGSRVRFSASLASAEAHNLKLSSRLLAVAQLIEGRGP